MALASGALRSIGRVHLGDLYDHSCQTSDSVSVLGASAGNSRIVGKPLVGNRAAISHDFNVPPLAIEHEVQCIHSIVQRRGETPNFRTRSLQPFGDARASAHPTLIPFEDFRIAHGPAQRTL